MGLLLYHLDFQIWIVRIVDQAGNIMLIFFLYFAQTTNRFFHVVDFVYKKSVFK